MSAPRTQFDRIAVDLYALSPSEFIAARTSYVAALKKSGDKQTAAAVGALRKPTITAWLVNILARREASMLADLFEIGAQLLTAQQQSDGRAMRQSSSARTTSIRGLTDRAVDLGRELGVTAGEGTVRDIASTLGAALMDPDIGQRVRAGRVTTAETYSGFGPALLSLVPDENITSEGVTAEDPDDAIERESQARAAEHEIRTRAAERAELGAALDAAGEELRSARADAERCAAESDEANRRSHGAAARLAALRREIEVAEIEVRVARETEQSSLERARTAQLAVEEAARVVEELTSAREELRPAHEQAQPEA